MERVAAGIRNSNAKFIREKSGFVLAEIYCYFQDISVQPASGERLPGASQVPRE